MSIKAGRWFSEIVICLSLLAFFMPALAGEKKAFDRKVAMVNGTLITEKDLDREVSSTQQQLSNTGKSLNDTQIEALKKNSLEKLINLEVLYQESQKRGTKIDKAAIEERWTKLKSQFPSEEEFKKALSRMNFSEDEIRSQIKKNLAIQGLLDQQIIQKIEVTTIEVKDYYDKHPELFKQQEQARVRQILIGVDLNADKAQKDMARNRIVKIKERLQKGEDFVALAKECSEDPSKENGGDVGYFSRGQLSKSLEDVSFTLNPGEVSDIVETNSGYYLIKCIDIKPQRTVAYEEIKDKLYQYLRQESIREKVFAYIGELKGKAKVERFLQKTP
jgi:peptidyl-prolyl cis-trans isomerase C